MAQQLGAVGQRAQPNAAFAGLCDQVLPRVLGDDHARLPLKPRHAGRIGQLGTKGPRLLFVVQDHAAVALLRAWTRIVASAAGVIPRMREASASVAGRAVSSLSTISRERPGIAAKASAS